MKNCRLLKVFILFIFLFGISLISVAQNEMEASCAKRIKDNSLNKTYSRYKGIILASNNTFKYDSCIIVITNSNPDLVSIFEKGLIFPELILTTSTSFQEIKIKYLPTKDTLYISDIEEIKMSHKEIGSKTFKFLNWRKGFANPSLYLFELKSDFVGEEDMKLFINRARLTAFGFCSILI